MTYRTIYWAAPRDGSKFKQGETLECRTLSWIPKQVAFYRDNGSHFNVGYTEGDCALALQKDGVKQVIVVEVGEISGFARLVDAREVF